MDGRVIHGLHDTPEYRIWKNIKTRCLNPRNCAFVHYGGRGIDICPEWADSFAVFYEAIGQRPSMAHSIDRIDNDRGYVPGNVRWATRAEQATNYRRNRRIFWNGENLLLKEWAARTGFKRGTIAKRLNNGWKVEDALTIPPR